MDRNNPLLSRVEQVTPATLVLAEVERLSDWERLDDAQMVVFTDESERCVLRDATVAAVEFL
jgi:hypothetical protein